MWWLEIITINPLEKVNGTFSRYMESNSQGLHYHPVGYMQISSESMRSDVAQIFEEQQTIGYDSEFVEGAEKSKRYMLEFFLTAS